MFSPTMTTLRFKVGNKVGLVARSNTLRSPTFEVGVAEAAAHTAQLAYPPCFWLISSNSSDVIKVLRDYCNLNREQKRTRPNPANTADESAFRKKSSVIVVNEVGDEEK